jgi:vesicle-fusing ATPase
LAQALKAKSLTIVNGPEVFSKFVGESEENIRKLFLPAREDEKKYGDESPLHVIVFDEIDAVCRQRGSDGSGTGNCNITKGPRTQW